MKKQTLIAISIYLFKRFYSFIFRGEGWEKERERNTMCGCFSRTPTEHLACNPGMCPDWGSNYRPFGLQAGTQSTESYQPELFFFFLNTVNVIILI